MTQLFIGTRDVVSLVGEQATSYLQGQISQDVEALAVGDSAWSLILQPQGKVDAWFRVTRNAEDSYLLDVDAGFGETLLARLKRFKLRVKADLALETWTLHAYSAPLTASEAESIEAPSSNSHIVATSADGQGTDVLGADLAVLSEFTAPADGSIEIIDAVQYERRRILAGIPAMGSELSESTIPAEARIVDASVSFTKGCYTGQELVARVDSRGDNTPRRLRVVQGTGSAAVGDELTVDEATAGQLTSVSADGDGFVALAYVKRSAFDAENFSLGGNAVDVSPVPADSK